jgi:Na+-translocating ferredoxin:NAD+ oxidoreductase RNF subunit RnfB
MEPVLTSITALGSLAACASLGLGIASKFLYVKENPLIAQVDESLPGTNCGGCGYPGCANYAKAIVEENADSTLCAPGGNDTIARIAQILGKEAVIKEPVVARVGCFGHNKACTDRCGYTGINSCGAAVLLNNGSKACLYGCLGYGDCVQSCLYDAIVMGKNGLPDIDEEKCTGCGKCVEACPKHIITLEEKKRRVILKCASKDPGKIVRKVCTIGCTGCTLCAKKCPEDALTMVDNLPIWDWNKCVNCEICSKECPRDCIFFDGKAIPKPKKAKPAPKEKTG